MAQSKNSAYIPDLVEYLVNEPTLVSRWFEFSNCLKSHSEDIQRWKTGIRNLTALHYEVFSEILERWVSRTPNQTVKDLCQHLRKMQINGLASKLAENFAEENVINVSDHLITEQAGTSSSLRRPHCHQNEIPPHPSKIQKLGGNLLPKPSSTEFVKSGQKINWPITHGTLLPTQNFSGREAELQQLNSHFESAQKLVLVCGFGGIGKTELCRKFIHDISLQVTTEKISRVWFHGDTFETLRNSISRLADHLGFSTESDLSPSQYFYNLSSLILMNCSRLLVIVDNVDHAFDEVMEVIKSVRTHRDLFIVVTSRNSSVLEMEGEILKLDVLCQDHVRSMLQQSIRNFTASDADLLGKLLQNYPLALQQAIAYIKQQQRDYRTLEYSVSDYITEFERKKSARIKMLNHKLGKLEHYELTTLVVWDMTLEKINESSVDLLNIIAYLEPDKVNVSFLKKIAQKSKKYFDDSLKMLFNYSLVKIEGRIPFLSIHRLVQEVMRLKVSDTNPNYAINLFEHAFLAWVKGRKDKFYRVLKHDSLQLNRICKFAFDSEVERYDKVELVVQFLLKHGRVDCAVEYTKLCFNHINFSSDLDDTEKIDLTEKVALYHLITGDRYATNEVVQAGIYDPNICIHYDDPDVSIQLMWELTQKFFPHNEMTFKVKASVALELYWRNENKEVCISLCHEVLNSPFDNLYENVYDSLIRAKGVRYETSEVKQEILEKLLDSKRKELGDNHSNTNKVMEMLAPMLESKGEVGSALVLFKKVQDFAMQFNQEEKEIKYKRKVIELELRVGNFDDITRDRIYTTFGHSPSFYEFHLESLQNFLIFCRSNLGENDKLTLRVKYTTALRLWGQNFVDKSLLLLEEITLSNEVGELEEAYETMQRFGVSLFQSRKYKQSKETLEKVHTFRQNRLGENHEDTNETKAYLAKSLEGLGDLDRAEHLRTEIFCAGYVIQNGEYGYLVVKKQ